MKQTASTRPRAAELERGAEVRQREFAAGSCCLAEHDASRIEIREVNEQRLAGRYHIREVRAEFDVRFDPGRPRADGKDAGVADDDDVGRIPYLRQRDDLYRKFRADAGGITHGKRNGGTRRRGQAVLRGMAPLPAALDYEYSACCMQDYDLNSTAFFVTVKTPTA